MFGEDDGMLTVDGVRIDEIVQKTGTPVYVTSYGKLMENLRAYKSAFPNQRLLYAVKANYNLAILKIIQKEGFGADVFSMGELYLALLAGFKPESILFNGNSKSDEEILAGIRAGVKFSVDSLDELYTISDMAIKEGKEVEIAFRVNPDVSPETHPKIATGLKKSKFGIPWEQTVEAYRIAYELPNVIPKGIHCHIGSQILSASPFIEAINRLFDVSAEIQKIGIELEFMDIGGGLGIDYEGTGSLSKEDFSKEILSVFEKRRDEINPELELWLEPGRSIVGDTTVLITRVNSVKRAYKNFVAVDAGFNTLIRPAMYNAYHRVSVANKLNRKNEEVYTIAGPICESGDILAEDRKLPVVEKGDLIAVYDAGAYGFVMSSQYNGRPRCAEVLAKDGEFYIIREREDIADIVGKQKIPELLF
ncbi:diaminopimelate decarboxylase [Archaeoglobus sulfaticallidus PM70-1]|uniref:Diaminopimelate decarboxylase n=1 Tax=Archaeoglobus sulfaticallidus PM70-1 TaxID=387631 RepID=N0BFD6_9EURY|nr:diaminopimelate decarboxylase [Archaeoglobus sulfaticallidus]AGK61738.1 diaminopimelate decarboxylase [Archaeoglobus sulfaticallidus PM70-1]